MDGIAMYRNMHFIRLKQYANSYLQSKNSSLTYYDSNEETQFRTQFSYKADLGFFATTMVNNKPKENPFDSDDD